VLLGAPAFSDGDGPTLREGAARMFTTGRGNKASTATAITLNALTLARSVIRKQTGLNGQPLNLDPNIIICGTDKELEANQLTVPLTPAQATNANPYSSRLTVVSDVNVTGNGWYLGCAPAMSPVVYGYVRGLNGPIISTETDFDTKGLKLQLQMAFGAGARDFRGMYRNAGA
jgi:phage major head subunit gpT-like protein